MDDKPFIQPNVIFSISGLDPSPKPIPCASIRHATQTFDAIQFDEERNLFAKHFKLNYAKNIHKSDTNWKVLSEDSFLFSFHTDGDGLMDVRMMEWKCE